MNKFKKAVSLIAVLAFLIIALVPMNSLAADPDPGVAVSNTYTVSATDIATDAWTSASDKPTATPAYYWAEADTKQIAVELASGITAADVKFEIPADGQVPDTPPAYDDMTKTFDSDAADAKVTDTAPLIIVAMQTGSAGSEVTKYALIQYTGLNLVVDVTATGANDAQGNPTTLDAAALQSLVYGDTANLTANASAEIPAAGAGGSATPLTLSDDTLATLKYEWTVAATSSGRNAAAPTLDGTAAATKTVPVVTANNAANNDIASGVAAGDVASTYTCTVKPQSNNTDIAGVSETGTAAIKILQPSISGTPADPTEIAATSATVKTGLKATNNPASGVTLAVMQQDGTTPVSDGTTAAYDPDDGFILTLTNTTYAALSDTTATVYVIKVNPSVATTADTLLTTPKISIKKSTAPTIAVDPTTATVDLTDETTAQVKVTTARVPDVAIAVTFTPQAAAGGSARAAAAFTVNGTVASNAATLNVAEAQVAAIKAAIADNDYDDITYDVTATYDDGSTARASQDITPVDGSDTVTFQLSPSYAYVEDAITANVKPSNGLPEGTKLEWSAADGNVLPPAGTTYSASCTSTTATGVTTATAPTLTCAAVNDATDSSKSAGCTITSTNFTATGTYVYTITPTIPGVNAADAPTATLTVTVTNTDTYTFAGNLTAEVNEGESLPTAQAEVLKLAWKVGGADVQPAAQGLEYTATLKTVDGAAADTTDGPILTCESYAGETGKSAGCQITSDTAFETAGTYVYEITAAGTGIPTGADAPKATLTVTVNVVTVTVTLENLTIIPGRTAMPSGTISPGTWPPAEGVGTWSLSDAAETAHLSINEETGLVTAADNATPGPAIEDGLIFTPAHGDPATANIIIEAAPTAGTITLNPMTIVQGGQASPTGSVENGTQSGTWPPTGGSWSLSQTAQDAHLTINTSTGLVTAPANATAGTITGGLVYTPSTGAAITANITVTEAPKVVTIGTAALLSATDVNATFSATVAGIADGPITLQLRPIPSGTPISASGTVTNGVATVTFTTPNPCEAAGDSKTYQVVAPPASGYEIKPDGATVTFKIPEADALTVVDTNGGVIPVDVSGSPVITMTAGASASNGEAPGTKTVNVVVGSDVEDTATGTWEAKPTNASAVQSAENIQITSNNGTLTITIPLGVSAGLYTIQFNEGSGSQRTAKAAPLDLKIKVQAVNPATAWITANGRIELESQVVNASGTPVPATGGTWNPLPEGFVLAADVPGNTVNSNPVTLVATSSANNSTRSAAYTLMDGVTKLPYRIKVSAVAPDPGATAMAWASPATILYSQDDPTKTLSVSGQPASATYQLMSGDDTVIASANPITVTSGSFNVTPRKPVDAVDLVLQTTSGSPVYATPAQAFTVVEVTGANAAGTLSVAPSSSVGALTYEWKTLNDDGTTGATLSTSATYAPTTPGKYQCIVKIAGTSVSTFVNFDTTSGTGLPDVTPGSMSWALQIADDPAITYPQALLDAVYTNATENSNLDGMMPTTNNLDRTDTAWPNFWHEIAGPNAAPTDQTVAAPITVTENSRFEINVPFTQFGFLNDANGDGIPEVDTNGDGVSDGNWQHGRDDYLEWEYRASGTNTNPAGGDVFTIPVNAGFYGVDSITFVSGPVTADMDGLQYRLVHRVAGTAPANQVRTPWITINVTDADKTVEVPRVTISSAPAQSQSIVNVAETGTVTFTADVQSGLASADLSYQWQSRVAPTASVPQPAWTDITGETKNTLTLTNVQSALNNVSYRCVVSNNSFASIAGNSNALTLNVNSAPGAVVITDPMTPAVINRYTGKTASFAVTATTNNGDAVTYQWYRRASIAPIETTSVIATATEASEYLSSHPTSQTAVTGATGASYTTDALEEGVYEYVCRVTNATNSSLRADSASFFVVVTQRSRIPYFTTQPDAIIGVAQGNTFTVSVAAAVQSQEPVSYQWQATKTPGIASSWSNLTGATSATLSIPNMNGDYNQWYFRCIASNVAAGTSKASNVTQLYVWNKADVPVVGAIRVGSNAADNPVLVSTATLASGATLNAYWVHNDTNTTWADTANPISAVDGTYTSTLPAGTLRSNPGSWTCWWLNPNTRALPLSAADPHAASPGYVYGTPVSALIAVQPVDVTAAVGTTATFEVGGSLDIVANAPLPSSLVYVWQRSTDGGYTWTNCTANDGTGQFTSRFTVPVSQATYDYATAANMQGFGNPYTFRVMVADRTYGNAAYSKPAYLNVREGTETGPAVTVKDGVSDVSITTDATVGKILAGSGLTISKDGTPVSALLDMLSWTPANQSYALRVVNAANEELAADAVVGTGAKVQLIDTANDDQVLDTVTVIVRGDVMGTGKMSLTQLVRMAASFKATDPTQLEGPYFLAGDLDGSGAINLTDLVQEATMYREQILNAGSEPTPAPTTEPSAEPTTEPSTEPTSEPSGEPTGEPTAEPTSAPTASQAA